MGPEKPAAGRPSAPTVTDVGRALSWLGLGHLAGQLWWYGSLIVLATMLAPRDFGTVAAGLVVVNLAQYLMDAGTRGSLIVAPSLNRALLRRALGFNVGAGLLLTLTVVALARPFVDTFASGGQAGPIRLLAFSVLLASFVPVPMALLQRSLSFKRQATVMASAATVASLVAVTAAVLGAGVWALALRQVLFQLVIACLSWWNARRLFPGPDDRPAELGPVRQEQAFWFFLVSLSQFLALNVDYLIVGGLTDAQSLGLYSLAFTIAFSPVTQFSSQIGKVVFPAIAATRERVVVARRALKGTRLLALIVGPFVPPAIALAPWVLPNLFGSEWQSMVVPFQFLLVAGAGTALLSVVQESLSGTGNVPLFAKVSLAWLASVTLALMVLVRLDGLRGAALAHVLLVVPVTAVYATVGARRIGLRTRSLLAGVRGIVGSVAVQGFVTAATVVAVRELGAGSGPAGLAGAIVGLGVVAVLLHRQADKPLVEARAVIAAVRRRAS